MSQAPNKTPSPGVVDPISPQNHRPHHPHVPPRHCRRINRTVAGRRCRPGQADEPALQLAPSSDTEQLLCATIGRLVEALGQALQDVPQYAPPAMDSHGNIILRRLNPPSDNEPDRTPVWTADQAST